MVRSTVIESRTAGVSDEDPTGDESWREAGDGWGHAALDWAHLFETYARDAVEVVAGETDIGPGTALLDVACGSGNALARFERLGATVSGIDASTDLVDIARRRAPGSDVRVGDMFALPWEDDRFDVVTSFNGIWGGCEAAVEEIARVLAPGGRVGLTFWGDPGELDLLDYFLVLGAATAALGQEITTLASISPPGAAEAMLEDAGLEVLSRGSTEARLEWVDAAQAWRGLRSPGLAVPALEAVGEDELRRRVMAAVDPFRAPDGSYLLRNELTHVVARARS